MFKRSGCLTLALLFIVVSGAPVFSADRVVVESKSVGVNSITSLGVYLENDVNVEALGVPLVFRSLTGNAYPSSITAFYNPAGRMPLGAAPVVAALRSYDLEDGSCRGGSGGFGTVTGENASGVTLSPASSPDAFSFNRYSVFPPSPMGAGSDFPIGTQEPSLLFDIVLTSDTGRSIVDTTCTDPANHLYFTKSGGVPVYVAFTAGLIEVTPCSCPLQGDIDASGVHDGSDWNLLIQVLFFNAFDVQYPDCPATRCDVNNDGVSDLVDLNDLAETIWFNGEPPCDPCNPIQALCR